MSAISGPNISRNGLVLALDVGNIKSFRGEPTINILSSPTMIPSTPTVEIISLSTFQSNVGSSGWDWGYFPNSDISPDGGMVWLPNEPDPLAGVGAWMMKKRPGGNSESNWAASNVPGSVNSGLTYTLSVYCKATVSNTARIHINVTRDGSSFWGYASNTHTGDGTWQRLILTIPGGSGVTSINVVRCQSIGTSINTNIYWKYFQIEQKPYPTPFVNGTRGTTVATGGGWADKSGNSNHGELVNGPTFNSGNGGIIQFDGSNDYIQISDNSSLNFSTGDFTVLCWVGQLIGYPGSARSIIWKGSRFDGNIAGWSITWAGSPADLYFIISSTGSRLEGRTNPSFGLNGWVGYKMIGMQRTGTSWRQINNTSITNLGTFSGDVDNTQPIYIARNGHYNTYLSCSVGNVQIYNRALSATEITQNYTALKTRFGLT